MVCGSEKIVGCGFKSLMEELECSLASGSDNQLESLPGPLAMFPGRGRAGASPFSVFW